MQSLISLYDNNEIIIDSLIKELFYLGNEQIISVLLNEKCYELTFKVFENEHFGNMYKYKEYYIPFYILFDDNNINIQMLLELLYINSRLKYIREVRFTMEKYDEIQKIVYSVIKKNNNDIIKCLLNNNNEILLQIISIIHSDLNSDLDIQKKTAIMIILLNLFEYYPNYQTFKKDPVSKITPLFNNVNFINELNKCEFIPAIYSDIIQISNSLLNFSNKNYLSYIFSYLNEKISKITYHNNIQIKIASLNKHFIYTLSLFIAFIRINAKPLLNNTYFHHTISFICQLLLLISPAQTCFNEIYQFIYSLIEIFSYEHTLFTNTFFNKIMIIYVKFISIPIKPEFTNIINKTLIRIIELLTHYIELNKGTSQYWLKINKVVPLLIKCINTNKNKHLILTSLQFIRKISVYVDKLFLDYLISDDLLNVFILLFEKNFHKQNAIFSTICSFFDGIKREKIILQKMLNLKIEFFLNDKYTLYFSRLIKYANLNINLNKLASEMNNNNNHFLSHKHNRLINDNMKLD